MMAAPKKTTDRPKSEPKMDRSEFAKTYQSLYKQLWLIAAGILGDRSEADDIVQEAAIVAYRKRNEFRPGSNFAGWVTGILKHCAMNHRRKRHGRKTFPTDPSTLDGECNRSLAGGSVDTSGGLTALSGQFDDQVIRGLAQLSPDARCCLLLRIVDGLSYAEISHLLDIPEGTAMSHVHRSKRLMRQQLQATLPSTRGIDG
jgi:RNA polymerase sigma-70 factor (ECF subfamily)